MAGTTVNLRLLIQATNKAAKQVTSLQGQLNEVSKAAQELAGKSKKAGRDGADAMKKFGSSTSGIKQRLDGIKESVEGIGAAGTALLGVAASLAATTFFPIKSAADFERALSKVTAVTTGAVERFQDLKNVASELGRTTRFTATEAAEGMIFLGQAGFEAGEVISGIGPALTLASAAGISLAESADIATNVIQAMRLPVEELTQATDILSTTFSSSNTNLLQLADALGYAAPLAAAAGVSLEETAAIIGVLGNNGIQASQAGTAMRGMLRSLAAPSKAARDILAELGVQIKVNADGSLDLIGVLRQLSEAQLTTAQANKLFGRFAAAGALAVTANIGQLEELIDANYNAAGATKRMAAIMKDNVRGALTRVTSALDGLRRAFGDPLLAPIKQLLFLMADLITGMTKFASQFPIVTKTIGLLIGVIIALTASLGALFLAISSVGFAAGQLSKALEVQLVVSFLRFGKAVQTTTALLLTSSTRALGLSRIFYAVGASVRWLGLQFKALWGVIVAHPILATIAILGALVVVLKEMANANKELIAENKKLASDMFTLYKQFTQFESKIKQMEAGSKKFTAEMLSMRNRLLEVAKNNDRLTLAATKAAHSIDEYSGAVKKGSTALEEYNQAVQDISLEAMRNQLEGLNFEMNLMLGQESGWEQFWQKFTRGWSIIATILPGMKYTMENFRKEELEAFKSLQRNIESSQRQYIKMLDTMGRFDMSLPRAEAQAFFEVIEGNSVEAAEKLTNLFDIMQAEMADTAEAARSIDSLTLDEAQQNVRDTIGEIKELNKELEIASLMAGDAVAAWNKLSEEEKKNAKELEESVRHFLGEKLRLNKEDREKTKQFNRELRAERELALQKVEDDYQDELRIINRQEKLKNITKFKADEERGKLEIKRRNASITALTEVMDHVRVSGKFEVEEAGKTTKAYLRETKKVGQASEDLKDIRIIHANEVAEAVRAINQEAARAEIGLLAEGEKRYRAEAEIQIASLKARAKSQDIAESELQRRIESINKVTQDRINKFNDAIEDKQNEKKIKNAERTADKLLDEYERAFKAGELSVNDYVANSIKAQTDAIDAQIDILEVKLKEAKRRLEGGTGTEAAVIDIEIDIAEAQDKRDKITSGATDAVTKLALQKAQKELAIDGQLLQGRLANMQKGVWAAQAAADQELLILKNKHAQELLALEAQGASDSDIRARRLQQIEAQNQKRIELDKAIFISQQEWLAQQADAMANIFGDMYELSGQKQKAFFYAEKAAAIARVIISTHVSAMKVMEAGWAGIIQKGLIYAQGATSIAKISAQNLAEGGEVKGRSPHKRADNIKINATAQEWVMPVDAVKKYGKAAMAGIQNMVFPKEVFRNYRLPRLRPAYASRGYASGGEVTEQGNQIKQQETVVPPPQPINIVNVVDPGELDRYLTSSAGQNAVLNVLSSRKEVVRRVLK